MYDSIVLAGPTAVGKTDLSIKLAKIFDMDIISADATQVYRRLDIGSAKITKDEMKGVKHYLLDIVNPDEPYSVGKYYEDVNKILNDNKDRKFLITGGTGLYIQSITDGISEVPKVNEKERNFLESMSLEELVQLLRKRGLSEDIDLNNKVRVIRKLEKGDMEYNNIKGNDRNFLKIFLSRNKDVLYDRINKRVDIMLEHGLLEEARQIYDEYGDIVSSIGYKELNSYFKGEISLDEAIRLIKRNSRRYAKRQFTWFRNKNYRIYDLDILTEEEIIEDIRREYGRQKYFR